MPKFLRNLFREEKGFTLIELIIVVVILALLAGIALLNTGGAEDDAKLAKARTDVDTIATALKVYKLKLGAYPATLADLTSNSGNYKAMLDEIPKDPFDASNAYNYVVDAVTGAVTLSTKGSEVSKTLK